MKTIKQWLLTGALMSVTLACQSTLDVTPKAVISSEELNTPENIDKMCVAAYSALGNDHYTAPFTLWPYGNLRSGDAYKGGAGTADISEFHFFETFSYIRPDLGPADEIWFRFYVSISRANDALRRLNAISEVDYPNKKIRQAEMRFLRGHNYFDLKIMFNRVPYIDETVAVDQYATIPNDALSSDQLWDKISADFRVGTTDLPATQPEVGRANQVAAKAYLAKTLLYQAYKQDARYNVTGIDPAKLAEVEKLTGEVIASGKYGLYDDFAKNFLPENDNGIESIFAIQRSIDDGTPKGRLDWSSMLNYPMNQEYGCCGFHLPSQNLINAFKTDKNGLPLFDTYNTSDITTPADFLSNAVDPRVDHTVAIPGHPYKYKPNYIFKTEWARAPEIYGATASMKETVAPDSPAFRKVAPFMSSSKNSVLIRYADVLLWRAEALIELGRQDEALPLINQLRQRASKSTGLLKDATGKPTSNYLIGTYQPGVNCTWNQSFARQALRWERRLELAMEGNRFFDLVRWGVAAEYLNSYFSTEKTKRDYLKEAKFTKNRDEYLPIPLNQINFSKGLYKQNPGW
ncbi:RagB/SusD family nutrient uptake outer membrane protein [Larkinella knui]|uniref:RagB/SusD family nutrient uptake outer membrane protein n=1 Tax=Larkinella knui TaxID=2025310 RepID=A0A3P1CPI0_9BACT|nr:RagB/SusD family nutrient uptake outer membrane protein [Larkinella knui]RRB15159.1 RagB/SusD family nutrient uptake outer membrane protein [Larkinella knui]